MEEGTEYKLMCDIIDVAPVQKLKVKWYRGNELVLTKEFNDTSVVPLNVSSTLKVIPERDYNAAVFRCEAELHLGPKGPELVPNVTSPPYVADVLYKPRIQGCPDRHAGVENEFSMDMLPCQGDGNPPPTVQWFYQGEPVNASEPLTRTQSGKYIAQVGNRLGRSNTSVDITIEYSPSFTCNDRYEVEEDGKLQTCEPKGKPTPTITWFKDGKKIASPQRWTKHDSGKYVLTASNKHGTVNHMLNLDVLYAPVFSEGSYMKEVAPGENVTFDCLAEGNPPPLIRWNNTAAVNVRVTAGGRQTSISVTGATSTNAGVYICVASNRVGNVTKSVILKMRGKTTAGPSPLIWGLLILLVVILLLLVAFILHSHKKKHGQYSFEPVNANDGSDIPMSTQSNGVRA
ncbi:intercellular adhesion molecule 5 [Enoplosus armatus]|uniref:intercellular adhesion molecule 5 n=1 Tax=Enoplosus armatus TaxID=215367 RepID=UPI0039947391